jgi:hypothetical protein
MGKKRSYQWQIGPDEGNVTDYKTHPNDPRETNADDQKFSRVMESDLPAFQSTRPNLIDPRVRRLLRRGRRGRRGNR